MLFNALRKVRITLSVASRQLRELVSWCTLNSFLLNSFIIPILIICLKTFKRLMDHESLYGQGLLKSVVRILSNGKLRKMQGLP